MVAVTLRLLSLVLVAAAVITVGPPPAGAGAGCAASRGEEGGSLGQVAAPLRSSVGRGYVLTGVIRSAATCRPLRGARVEFWLMNDRGEYDAAHRGAVRVGRDGVYRFQTNRPRSFEGRQGHIHMLVRAPGHRLLLTEHFPRAGRAQGRFDLVIPTLPGV